MPLQDVFPSKPEQFFNLLFKDDSKFTSEYRSVRKDSNLLVSFSGLIIVLILVVKDIKVEVITY